MIDSMSTPGAELGPSTSMISPSGLTWRDSHGSSRTTTLSPSSGRLRQRRLRWNLDVNVVDDARIVRHDVEEIFRLLQRADDRVVRAFENANHAAFGAALTASRARVTFIAGDPRHHSIAVHRRAGIFGRDKEVLLSRLSRRKKCVARLVHVQLARDEIRFRRQDVAILADTRDFSGLLELRAAPRSIPCERRSSGRGLFPARPYRAADTSAR